ncbi:MAG: hypothetical protein IJ685_13970 [Selenomonadaceae bacterium]|nr:hypothetical protein [Selenomonadaceae bacterium]
MNKRTLIEKLQTMAASPSCYPDLKQVTHAYLKLVEAEIIAAKNLVAELNEDIVTIDELVEISHSKETGEKFGAEAAKKFAANADALKVAGAKYCNCLACTLALEILDNQELFFGETVSGSGMDKRTLIEKLDALRTSPSCYPDLKQSVKNYLVALAAKQVAAKNLIAELEEDVVDIDTLIEHVSSDIEHFIKFFGVEGAKLFAENAYKLKAAGAKYCNCLACTIALEILDNKDVLLT